MGDLGFCHIVNAEHCISWIAVVVAVCVLQNSDPSDVIYTSGCIEQGEVWVNQNLIPVAGVFVGLALVQVGGKYPQS